MGSYYIHGLIEDSYNKYIYSDANPDIFLEFSANEFRKLYYVLGLYCEFCYSSSQSFEKYLDTKGLHDIDASDNKIDWHTVCKGVKFVRDTIIKENTSLLVPFCSGKMLKKLAYKRRGKKIAIPRKADKIIEEILEYICNIIADKSIQQCFIKILKIDVLRVSKITVHRELTRIQCRDALLTFQIRMLQSKRTNSSRHLLNNLCNIDAYKYILE